MGAAVRSLAWRRRALLFAVGYLAFPFAVVAGEATAALGNARVRYDDTRWRAEERPDRVSFLPVGKEMRFIDSVELRVVDGGESCAALAQHAFGEGLYDTAELKPASVVIGGIPGERFAAHTGCRNATPQGVVMCVKAGGLAYLLQALNAGCQGRNLFSGVDPLAEIANGISFATADHR